MYYYGMQDIKYNMQCKQKPAIMKIFRVFQANTGLTQVDIAKEIGCSQPFLSLMLHGKRFSEEKVAALQQLILSANGN